MTLNNNKIRFYLFSNSYSGNKISLHLRNKFSGKKLAGIIRNLSVVLSFDYKETNDYILFNIKPNSPYIRLPNTLKVYLEVENELSKLSEEKIDEYSTALDDYQRKLLYPAIERASGNLINSYDEDFEFEKILKVKIKLVTRIYYKVAYKYKLPTLRVVPFILRLVSFP